jgi:Na+-transporting NADH:ubiquinone oxidoreductase subunit A
MTEFGRSRMELSLPPRLLLTGVDGRRLRPKLEVAEGDRVVAGQSLARDRKRPWIRVISPVSGTVRAIVLGARRTLGAIELEPGGTMQPETGSRALPIDPAAARWALVEAGLWTAVRARPFDGIADPRVDPRAILVTGFLSDHETPDLARLLDEGQHGATDFDAGLAALAGLGAGRTVLAHAGAVPDAGPAATGVERVQIARGPQARSLALLVRAVGPATPERPVWHLDWQDACAIGRWLRCGAVPSARTVAFRGCDAQARLLRVCIGTPIDAIARSLEVHAERLVLGHPALGHRARALARHDDRLSLLPAPFVGSAARRPGPIVPLPLLEAAMPGVVAPVGFLRAIASGDTETAVRMGLLNMGPEDVAACTLLCLSGNDYASLLARTLDRMEREWR